MKSKFLLGFLVFLFLLGFVISSVYAGQTIDNMTFQTTNQSLWGPGSPPDLSVNYTLIACLKWEKEEYGAKPSTSEIWWRFPKFVLGFFVASVIITVIASGYTMQDYDKIVQPELIKPIKNLRSWTFIFCFLSIGLTTRFRELAAAGKKPFSAFTIGVAVNVILGFVLSVLILGNYWINAVK